MYFQLEECTYILSFSGLYLRILSSKAGGKMVEQRKSLIKGI